MKTVIKMSKKAIKHITSRLAGELRERMSKKEFEELKNQLAKEAMLIDIDKIDDEDLKRFIIENIDEACKEAMQE